MMLRYAIACGLVTVFALAVNRIRARSERERRRHGRRPTSDTWFVGSSK